MARFTFTAASERPVQNLADTSAVAYLTATGPVAGGIAETGALMPLSGTPYANGAAASTTGTTEDVLMTYTLPANALSSVGKALKIQVFGSTTNDAQTKTVKVYLGSTALTTTALTVTSKANWTAEFTVVKTSAGHQAFTGSAGAGSTNADLASVTYFGTATETDTADIIIKVTGTTALAGSVVTAQSMTVRALN